MPPRAQKATPKGKRWLDYMPLAALAPAPRNPKEHDGDKIQGSMDRFGFTEPITLDERTKFIVAGHGRREALIALKEAGHEPPDGVEVGPDGEWLVPVVRGWTSQNDDEAEAYLVTSNRLVELGGWADELLGRMLRDLEAKQVHVDLGWSERDIRKMLGENARGELKQDKAPPLPVTPVTQPGDLWILGGHRLLCGDSTDPRAVARLMDGQRAILMSTDPPYGISYSDKDTRPGAKGAAKFEAIANDDLQGEALRDFLLRVYRPAVDHAIAKNAAWYMWHASATRKYFEEAMVGSGVLIHQEIVWVKPSLVFGFADYHFQHEPCLYGWLQGNKPSFYGERNQTTVWEISHDVAGTSRIHPTQKPVELFAIPIRNHTKEGEICFEPFCGSGSQISAAEQLGRRCFAMELSPGYCDVVVARWENLSGGKATRVVP